MSSGPATHLPSFAQAFSSDSLERISSTNNSLPPIVSNSVSAEPRRVNSPAPTASPPPNEDQTSRTAGRKRARADSPSRNDSHSDSNEQPIKQEPDQDNAQPSSARLQETPSITDTSGAPAPSSVHPSKKRRVTISGAPALNTDVRAPPEPGNTTPISPVIVGFTVDNPAAAEQVKSMMTVKQKQKALIEQRRGSISSVPNGEPAPKPAPSVRSVRRSPNAASSSRRPANNTSNNRQPSPAPAMVPSQPAVSQPVATVNPHSLPAPPISFARRRANQFGPSGKKKPADILISPREEQTPEQLAPSIQSAPPIPHAGFPGRFPMTLPRLPSVLGGGDNVRRTVGTNVPPTPTRLSAMRNSNQVVQPIPTISGRSPPTASVAIASTLVPPTPHSLHHSGYSGDKSAFLAPFELFYDALNDSKQLKNWLGEQLQRSQTLVQNLTQQQDRIHEMVESLVEKKVAGMKHEMAGLYRRIEELEDALRVSSAGNGRRLSADGLPFKPKGKQPLRNGLSSISMAPESYTFPPDRDRMRTDVSDRRLASPSPAWRQHDRESAEAESETPRRLSLSASRLDPPRNQRHSSDDSNKSSYHSPPMSFRDSPHLPPPVKLLRVGTHKSPRMSALDRPASGTPPPRKDEGRSSSVKSTPDDNK